MAVSPLQECPQLFVQIRLAKKTDVPFLHKLIHQLAISQRLAHIFSATQSSLSSTLFPTNYRNAPPFSSFSIFILQVSSNPFTNGTDCNNINNDDPHHFNPIFKTIELNSHIVDTEADFFRSDENDDSSSSIAGFVLFSPHYSSFLGKPSFYVEDLYVRGCYRSKGLGRMLLSAVATQAANMGYGRVEWAVADWNVDAIKFYEQMGAEVLPEWRTCRLSGEALHAYIYSKQNLN